MFSVSHLALAGLQAAETRMAVRAKNIVNAYTPGYRSDEPHQISTPSGPFVQVRPGNEERSFTGRTQNQGPTTYGPGQPPAFPHAPGNNVNLAVEMVDLKQAETSYKAAIAVLKTGQDMEKSLLEMIA